MMARVLVPSQSDLWPGESWWCTTAPGTASGFKGVQLFGKQWRARVWIKGKGTRTICTASTAKEAAWLLARWHHYPCELPSPEKQPDKASNGMGRSSDGEERAPLSPRRLNASSQRVVVPRPCESGKRQKCAVSEPEARPSVPVDWETRFSYVPC